MAKNTEKDRKMASTIRHIVRTTGVCPICYRIVTCEAADGSTKNKHIGNCSKK